MVEFNVSTNIIFTLFEIVVSECSLFDYKFLKAYFSHMP